MLIENAVPSLPYRLDRINRFEAEDPEVWASEMHDLQQDIMETFTVDFLSRQKERDQEVAGEMAAYWEQDAVDRAERELEEKIDQAGDIPGGAEIKPTDDSVKVGKPKRGKSRVKK